MAGNPIKNAQFEFKDNLDLGLARDTFQLTGLKVGVNGNFVSESDLALAATNADVTLDTTFLECTALTWTPAPKDGKFAGGEVYKVTAVLNAIGDMSYKNKSAVKINGVAASTADYSVVYSNNKNAGKAKAKVTTKGDYSGTVPLTYQSKEPSP